MIPGLGIGSGSYSEIRDWRVVVFQRVRVGGRGRVALALCERDPHVLACSCWYAEIRGLLLCEIKVGMQRLRTYGRGHMVYGIGRGHMVYMADGTRYMV